MLCISISCLIHKAHTVIVWDCLETTKCKYWRRSVVGFWGFCFLFHTYHWRSVCTFAWDRIRFFSFLSVNSHEGSTRLPICSLLDLEFSHRVQKGMLLLLSHCDVNTYTIQGVREDYFFFLFFFLSSVDPSVLTNKLTKSNLYRQMLLVLTNGYILWKYCCVRDHLEIH